MKAAVVELAMDDGGARRSGLRALADEAPVALEVNGVAMAVMMATPADLEAFATGFCLSEGLITRAGEIEDLAVAEAEGGWIVRIALAAGRAAPLVERVRLRVSEGSCGLCGVESIEQVLRPLPAITARLETDHRGIARALDELRAFQPVGRETGAMHAAAFCAPDGAIRFAMEDVGRHNALDKLIGALALQGADPREGFILVSARCSYELVDKAVRAGCPMLVSISAATSLAVGRSRDANLTLLALARTDSALVMHDPHGQFAA